MNRFSNQNKYRCHLGARGNVMRRFLTCLMTALVVAGCEKETFEGKALARINNYTLTLNEFEAQLAADLEMDSSFKLTREAREAFLDQLVRKELLIQEAMKLKLDRKETFIRAIERYWQSTLIRDLIALKGEEISRRTIVAEEEIEAQYGKMKAENSGLPPLDEIREKVLADLKEAKQQEKLKEWIENLKKDAKIEITKGLI